MMEFFALLFLAYEAVSIVKNMSLCGLPVKKVWLYLRSVLGKYTDELPDADELETTGCIDPMPMITNNDLPKTQQ